MGPCPGRSIKFGMTSMSENPPLHESLLLHSKPPGILRGIADSYSRARFLMRASDVSVTD